MEITKNEVANNGLSTPRAFCEFTFANLAVNPSTAKNAKFIAKPTKKK